MVRDATLAGGIAHGEEQRMLRVVTALEKMFGN